MAGAGMAERLRGRSIAITGASSGIGEACARGFAAVGGRLKLAARRVERLEALAPELERAGAAAVAVDRLDVRDPEAVETVCGRWTGSADGVDVLVANAGLSRGLAPLHRGSKADWDEMVDTNVKGLLYVERAIVPHMVERGSGTVIHIGSIAGREVYPGGNVYCATKHAVAALTAGMRLDLAGTGVRVCTVDPGMVDTEFSEVRFHGDRTRASAVYRGMTPLEASDVAEVVVFAASRPPHVNLAEALVLPADQASATTVHRSSGSGTAGKES